MIVTLSTGQLETEEIVNLYEVPIKDFTIILGPLLGSVVKRRIWQCLSLVWYEHCMFPKTISL